MQHCQSCLSVHRESPCGRSHGSPTQVPGSVQTCSLGDPIYWQAGWPSTERPSCLVTSLLRLKSLLTSRNLYSILCTLKSLQKWTNGNRFIYTTRVCTNLKSGDLLSIVMVCCPSSRTSFFSTVPLYSMLINYNNPVTEVYSRAIKDNTVCPFNTWILLREDTVEITVVSVVIR